MATATTLNEPIIIGAVDLEKASAMRWLSPILLGLLAPAILALFFLPEGILQSTSIIFLMLTLMLVLSIAAYIATIIVPGDAVEFQIDSSARSVRVLLSGPFAGTVREIAFDEITGFRAVVRYDDDGYSENTAQLTMHTGEVIAVPLLQPMDEFQAARQAIGLVRR